MSTSHHLRAEHAMLKLALLLALALVFVLLITRSAAAEFSKGERDARAVTGPLVLEDTIPLIQQDQKQFYFDGVRSPSDAEIWELLGMHRKLQFEEALAKWQNMRVPKQARIWKSVAMSALLVRTGNANEAVKVLSQTNVETPGNAAVHYYLGVSRMAQAGNAPDWDELPKESNIQYVVARQPEEFPNTKEIYEQLARQAFEKAIELAPDLDLDAPLMVQEFVFTSLKSPQVANEFEYVAKVKDLLASFGDEHFPAKSHCALADFLMNEGELDESERHLDAAAQDISVSSEYYELGTEYQLDARHSDATRVFMKAMKGTKRISDPAKRVWESLKKL